MSQFRTQKPTNFIQKLAFLSCSSSLAIVMAIVHSRQKDSWREILSSMFNGKWHPMAYGNLINDDLRSQGGQRGAHPRTSSAHRGGACPILIYIKLKSALRTCTACAWWPWKRGVSGAVQFETQANLMRPEWLAHSNHS